MVGGADTRRTRDVNRLSRSGWRVSAPPGVPEWALIGWLGVWAIPVVYGGIGEMDRIKLRVRRVLPGGN